MREQCEEMLWRGWSHYRCANKARPGKTTCGIHCHERVEALRAKSEARKAAARAVRETELALTQAECAAVDELLGLCSSGGGDLRAQEAAERVLEARRELVMARDRAKEQP